MTLPLPLILRQQFCSRRLRWEQVALDGTSRHRVVVAVVTVSLLSLSLAFLLLHFLLLLLLRPHHYRLGEEVAVAAVRYHHPLPHGGTAMAVVAAVRYHHSHSYCETVMVAVAMVAVGVCPIRLVVWPIVVVLLVAVVLFASVTLLVVLAGTLVPVVVVVALVLVVFLYPWRVEENAIFDVYSRLCTTCAKPRRLPWTMAVR